MVKFYHLGQKSNQSATSFALGVDPVTGAVIRVPTTEVPTIVKRKKKKTKKKNKTKLEFKMEENEEAQNKRRKSCHSKCKDDYETEKNSFKGKDMKAILQYAAMYQSGFPLSSSHLGLDSTQRKFKHKIDLVLSLYQPYMSLQNTGKKVDPQSCRSVKALHKIQSSSKIDAPSIQPNSQRSSGSKKNLSKRTVSSKNVSRRDKSSVYTEEILAPRSSMGRDTPIGSRVSIPMSAEILYLQGLERMSSRERIAEDNKLKKEQEELAACTFKPNILEISRKKSMPE